MTKRLLECPEYQAIKSLDGHAGKCFQEHSVPSLFRNGVYAVPLAMVERWAEFLREYQRERCDLVRLLAQGYAEARHAAQGDLGPLYRAEEYPDVEEVVGKFFVEVRYLELGVPGRLELIAPESFRQAQAELIQTVEQGKLHIEAILCQEAVELVQGLRGALEGLEDAQPKRFYQSHIDKLAEWSTLFLDARNVTGFDGLAQVAEQLENLARGIDRETVKKFGFIRAEVKRELEGVMVTLKGLMEERPTRQMTLD